MPSSSRRKKEKMKLMEDSGQTDAQRRRLRAAQRSLQKTIVDNGEAMENPTDDTFSKIRDENNDLFEKVKYAREAVLDGENLDMIATHAARQVDSLVQVPRYDALRFVQRLKKKCAVKHGATSFFDWATLGKETGTCFNAVPCRVQFLAGPLAADFTPAVRKPRAKRQKQQEEESENEEEERPEDVKHQERNANQLSAVEQNIAVVRKTLRKRSKEEYRNACAELGELPEEEQESAKKKIKETAGETCAIKYMFNPNSFTQTVENMFHYSFLVKKGEGKIAVRDGKPKVAYNGVKEAQQPPARQAVVSLTMRDWRRLSKAYKVKKSDIPNRSSGSKHAKRAAAARRADSDEEEE